MTVEAWTARLPQQTVLIIWKLSCRHRPNQPRAMPNRREENYQSRSVMGTAGSLVSFRPTTGLKIRAGLRYAIGATQRFDMSNVTRRSCWVSSRTQDPKGHILYERSERSRGVCIRDGSYSTSRSMLNHLSTINDACQPSPKMSRTPRVSLTTRKELTLHLRAQTIEAYWTGSSMRNDRVEAVIRAQGGYTNYWGWRSMWWG